ncbi:MAG: hypothetical protein ACJAUY_000698 [Cognaticolwellia sp.]|jgi:hypothetical protein
MLISDFLHCDCFNVVFVTVALKIYIIDKQQWARYCL